PSRIRELLGWTPQLDDLDKIVASSLAWERNMRYPPPPAPPPGRTTPSS
ncbi:MAG TPA: UDP-glucose 4-epimerase GalE, partial [Gammaproteobacteria bacterium]|nr:UDP-glucose 4-epimerase GalE [Gammaproteobacteria bacterium]